MTFEGARERARARNRQALITAVVVAAVIALLLWKTQWPTLRPGLTLLLIFQVLLSCLLYLHGRELNLDPLNEQDWYARERRVVKRIALIEGIGRLIAFAVLGYGLWQWTGNLPVAIALGLLYPASSYWFMVRPSANRSLRQIGILTAAFVMVFAAHAQTVSSPQIANPSKARLPGEDWVSIFNGQDLKGWTKIGQESWAVEEGTIHGRGVTKDYGYLQTEMAYRDFQLSLRFKCEGDGNSGVFFHSAFKPGTAEVTQGLQFEIDCTIGQHTAGLYGDGRGWLVWPAPENETVVRKGEWNEYLLEVLGNRYRSRLNGVPMVDFTDPKPKSFDGPIALQLHAGGRGDMRFRDIMIRDLSKR